MNLNDLFLLVRVAHENAIDQTAVVIRNGEAAAAGRLSEAKLIVIVPGGLCGLTRRGQEIVDHLIQELERRRP